jgi:hypothetical protein
VLARKANRRKKPFLKEKEVEKMLKEVNIDKKGR